MLSLGVVSWWKAKAIYLVLIDSNGERLNGLNVQVISRFVQYEKVGPMGAENCEGHARLLSSGQAANLHEKHN